MYSMGYAMTWFWRHVTTNAHKTVAALPNPDNWHREILDRNPHWSIVSLHHSIT